MWPLTIEETCIVSLPGVTGFVRPANVSIIWFSFSYITGCGANAKHTSVVFTQRLPLPPPPGELLPGSHLADEDEPDLLLVSGFRLLSPLCPPGGAVSTYLWRPAVRDRDQRLRCRHGREEQLLRSFSRQLESWTLM